MLSSTSTSLKHLTEMKSRKRRVRARFSALMRRLAPFLASEEADPSTSGMSERAQAAVLRDADGYIINTPSATLLVFFSSQSSVFPSVVLISSTKTITKYVHQRPFVMGEK